MKLIELKELAKQMGLRGTSTMRKPESVSYTHLTLPTILLV